MTDPFDVTDADPFAVAVMVAYCGWNPLVSVTAEVAALDGAGTLLLQLPTLYLRNVSAVSVTDWAGDVTTPTLGLGNQVGWTQDGSIFWNGYGLWPTGQQNITVTYDAGYLNPPDDLAAALGSVTKRIPNMTSGYASRRMGTAGVTMSAASSTGDLLLVEKMVFDGYRIVRAA